ncbi:MAG: hypothetical protein VX421_04800, partial [Pseudomonadota bacterium]|nr:hypothetical protein [Pseudomonadota bacterium]
RLDLDMAYHSSVGCDRRGDQPTGYATPSACFHTPEITITLVGEVGGTLVLGTGAMLGIWKG